AANRSTSDASEQLPPPREITRQEERKEQADGLDWLHGTKIDFRAAPARATAKHDQQRAQANRTEQWKVAQLEERRGSEVDHREGGHQPEADDRAFGIPDEQRHVAKG